jgi:DNA-directed RNA polymerase specialized sigma24 family protein
MRADDHGRAGSAQFVRRETVRRPTRREIRRLRQLVRAAEASARRSSNKQRAFALRDQGRSLREISQEIGVSHQTVANWLGGVHERPEAYRAVLVS